MDCTNKNCPAYAKCLAPYRGSRCKATRATYSLGDPITKADSIRAMTDEELAEFLLNRDLNVVEKTSKVAGFTYKVDREACLVNVIDWLKQEVSE